MYGTLEEGYSFLKLPAIEEENMTSRGNGSEHQETSRGGIHDLKNKGFINIKCM